MVDRKYLSHFNAVYGEPRYHYYVTRYEVGETPANDMQNRKVLLADSAKKLAPGTFVIGVDCNGKMFMGNVRQEFASNWPNPSRILPCRGLPSPRPGKKTRYLIAPYERDEDTVSALLNEDWAETARRLQYRNCFPAVSAEELEVGDFVVGLDERYNTLFMGYVIRELDDAPCDDCVALRSSFLRVCNATFSASETVQAEDDGSAEEQQRYAVAFSEGVAFGIKAVMDSLNEVSGKSDIPEVIRSFLRGLLESYQRDSAEITAKVLSEIGKKRAE